LVENGEDSAPRGLGSGGGNPEPSVVRGLGRLVGGLARWSGEETSAGLPCPKEENTDENSALSGLPEENTEPTVARGLGKLVGGLAGWSGQETSAGLPCPREENKDENSVPSGLPGENTEPTVARGLGKLVGGLAGWSGQEKSAGLPSPREENTEPTAPRGVGKPVGGLDFASGKTMTPEIDIGDQRGPIGDKSCGFSLVMAGPQQYPCAMYFVVSQEIAAAASVAPEGQPVPPGVPE